MIKKKYSNINEYEIHTFAADDSRLKRYLPGLNREGSINFAKEQVESGQAASAKVLQVLFDTQNNKWKPR